MDKVRSWIARVILSVVVLLPVTVAIAPGAQASTASYTKLHLINGWTQSPFGTRKAQVILKKGIVVFRGAISQNSGSNPEAFVLPLSFRPSSDVYVPVDQCGATNGRLFIQTNGVVEVEAEKLYSSAQCFTSLEGVSFAKNASGYTPLTLQNGWTNAPFSTRNASAKVISGVVHLQGAIASGTDSLAFTLPVAFRPTGVVYVAVDLCDATNGRIQILPNGNAFVETEGPFSDAQCFTSLEGATYAKTASGYTPLTLQNGWTNYGSGTRAPAIRLIAGVERFQGAIANGASGFAFTLPSGMAPTSNVFVKVDLCDATNGRLDIDTSGNVVVQTEGPFSDAQCFTSLEGVSFASG